MILFQEIKRERSPFVPSEPTPQKDHLIKKETTDEEISHTKVTVRKPIILDDADAPRNLSETRHYMTKCRPEPVRVQRTESCERPGPTVPPGPELKKEEETDRSVQRQEERPRLLTKVGAVLLLLLVSVFGPGGFILYRDVCPMFSLNCLLCRLR